MKIYYCILPPFVFFYVATIVTFFENFFTGILTLQEYLNGNRKSSIVPQSEPESKILHYLMTNGWIAANWWSVTLYDHFATLSHL